MRSKKGRNRAQNCAGKKSGSCAAAALRAAARLRQGMLGKNPPELLGSGTDELIRIVNLCKVYDTGAMKVVGLRDINLTIRRGEFVAIMGQSGSGKSTLMNILGCLDRPVIGRYYLDGIDINAMDGDQLSLIRNRKIGFVFQSFNLISRTTARENVELPMVYAHVPKRERHERAGLLLERVGLGARTEHMPNEMSGGQRQRVAIARALANEPPLILADEPTGNLDTAASVEIMELFSELHREGATVVVVTHEEDIAAFAQRTIRFRDGRIISDRRNGSGADPSPGTMQASGEEADGLEPAAEMIAKGAAACAGREGRDTGAL